MNIVAKAFIFLLLFSHFQSLSDLNTSEANRGNNLEANVNLTTTEASRAENPSKIFHCDWQIDVFANGSASVHVEIGLNWTGNIESFTFETPRTMEYRDSKCAQIKNFTPYKAQSIGHWYIYPELAVNTSETIFLEFYWPLAASFYRNRWYFPAYEYLPLFPDEHNITTEKMRANVTLPSGTQEESIKVDLESHKGYKNKTEYTTVTLQVDNPQTTRSSMPPIMYAGPPKPVGQNVEILSKEFTVEIPSIFEPNTTTILTRIENVSRVLKNWLNLPVHRKRVSIFCVPPFEEMSGDVVELYNSTDKNICIQGAHIYSLIDPLRDSRYVLEGLESLAQQMMYSYTPRIRLPDFFIEGLAQFGKYQCLLELGYNSRANELVNSQFDPLRLDYRIWSWQWSIKLKTQKRFERPSFYILYNLTTWVNYTQLFKKFLLTLEEDHIQFVNGLTKADKWRLFIRYLNRAAGKDLIPFFQQWGLQIDSTIDKFVQVSHWVVFALGGLFLVLGGFFFIWPWRILPWRKTTQVIFFSLAVMYVLYVMLPHMVCWLPISIVVWPAMILYHSLYGTLTEVLLLLGLNSFAAGYIYSKTQHKENTT